MVRGGEEVVRGSEEMPRSSEKFREVGLNHDMRGRYAPGMAAKWSHLLLVL